MPRKYIRKTTRQSWNQDEMKKAMDDVQQGLVPINSAAKSHKVPEATLRRYVWKYSVEKLPSNAGRFKITFKTNEIDELKAYVIDIDKRAFGLTKIQFGKICYTFAEGLGINHRFNKEKKVADRDFIENFMKECKLVLRKPEATSAARLLAFNRVNVAAFFSLLKELRLKLSYNPSQIYNADETGLSTVPTKSPKVISPIGNRRVIKISSAERGANVTAVCAMNAAGNFVPPYFIFPRVRMNPSFLIGVPAGFDGMAHETGWMTADNFLKYLEHFAKYTRPSKENPILLLMDNHASHITLEAIKFCREHYITFLGFPPHTTHKLQPLDVAFYGPLKTSYSQACENFLISNPGRTISIKDVPILFANAYLKVANMQTAINGFKATGIEPFDSNIFTDNNYAPAETTDRPEPQEYSENSSTNCNQSTHLKEIHNNEMNNQLSLETDNINLTIASSSSVELSEASTSILPPLPKATRSTTRQRKKLPSLLITSTPVKNMLEDKENEKENKKRKREMKVEIKEEQMTDNKRQDKRNKKEENKSKKKREE